MYTQYIVEITVTHDDDTDDDTDDYDDDDDDDDDHDDTHYVSDRVIKLTC